MAQKQTAVYSNIKHRHYRVLCDTCNMMRDREFSQGEIVIGAETRELTYGGAILVRRNNREPDTYLLYTAELEIVAVKDGE